MKVENKLQAIVTDIATTAAQGFLSTLPPEAAQTLSPKFLHSLSQDVQADLQSAIQSRLQWSLQAVKAELDEQQRQEQTRNEAPSPAVTPAPKPAVLPQAELLESASSSLEPPAESGSITEPLPAFADTRHRRTHDLVPKSAPRKQTEAPDTPSPLPGPNINGVHPSSQPELPVTAGLESLKPYQRLRGIEPQMSREEIMNAYDLSPTDFTPRPAGAVRRKRRTSVAMS